jgi:hypothetical protein
LKETKRRSTIAADDIISTFSATPPFEGLRILISWTMSCRTAIDPLNDIVLLVIDISRAHPHCIMTRVLHVALPEECNPGPDECAILNRLMYGCRDANQGFELKVAEVMVDCNMIQGRFSPCVYKDAIKERGAAAWVHGDDFVIRTLRRNVEQFVKGISKHLITKVKAILGPRPNDDKSIRILNRMITWRDASHGIDEAIEVEADGRHRELALRQLGLDNKAKGVTTPGIKVPKPERGPNLPQQEISPYRSVTMRLAFLAQDRWELKFSTKETARFMSEPCQYGQDALKRIGRFLITYPRVVQIYRRQPPVKKVKVFSDSNHADCSFTRKSTSCCASLMGSHAVQFASTTQISLSLSSAESEWKGLVKAAATGIGLQSLSADYGYDLELELLADASAAIGIGSRRGAGRLKHLDTGLLWLQDLVTRKALELTKTPGETNVADLGTKHLAAPRMRQLMAALSLEFRTGTHKLALRAL